MSPLTRRSVLIGGASLSALALHPHLAHAATAAVSFTLDATVLDGGEQVTSVTLDTRALDPINPASLTTATFSVHAKATSPIPLAEGDLIFSEYDLDRVVTAARIVGGRIVLDLESVDGAPGGGTLGYILSRARNFPLTLVYTITQNAALTLSSGGSLLLPGFVQGALVNPEVDAYRYGTSKDGMNYRLFVPEDRPGRGKLPLIVWLHGGGEGGSLRDDHYDNEPQLRGNRGALGFSTPEAQRIFGGAYVVAPQAESFWLEDGPAYAPRVKALIDSLVAHHQIDRDRVYVVGCSNGGYMSLLMTATYREFFAASVPTCGVVRNFPTAGINVLSDAQLMSIRTPTWLVWSSNDMVVPPADNSEVAAALIPGALVTEYETVTWNGISYNGHWSWIYVARNDPHQGGQHVWQWMASQTLPRGR